MPSVTQGNRGKRRRMMSDINVVPYIDVMLVLLIIFMVTAPLVTPAVINLPSVGKASQVSTKPLEIIIKTDGSVLIRDRDNGESEPRPIRLSELNKIALNKQNLKPDQPVVISADRQVKYETVLQVMDDLNKNQVKRIGLAVKAAQ